MTHSCVTWLILAWHDSLLLCPLATPFVWNVSHKSLVCDMTRFHLTCQITYQWFMWHDSSHTNDLCDMTRHIPMIYVTWLVFIWHDSFSWLILMWRASLLFCPSATSVLRDECHDVFARDVTRSYVYVPWLILMWYDWCCACLQLLLCEISARLQLRFVKWVLWLVYAWRDSFMRIMALSYLTRLTAVMPVCSSFSVRSSLYDFITWAMAHFYVMGLAAVVPICN